MTDEGFGSFAENFKFNIFRTEMTFRIIFIKISGYDVGISEPVIKSAVFVGVCNAEKRFPVKTRHEHIVNKSRGKPKQKRAYQKRQNLESNARLKIRYENIFIRQI